MKPGGSSLNPYAAAYVPLSKRGVPEQNKDFNAAQGGNENVWHGYQPVNSWTQGGNQNSSYTGKWKGHPVGEFSASSSQNVHEMPGKSKSNHNEEFDMDLAYLQMTYPGISEESLSDVYLANNFDLDAAVDMLDQLELHPDDCVNKLPETLDIGDVTSPRLKKNVTEEASTSSSS